jgi:hypothetical protein
MAMASVSLRIVEDTFPEPILVLPIRKGSELMDREFAAHPFDG